MVTTNLARQTYMTRVEVREVMGREILAGKSDGLRDFPKLLGVIEETTVGGTVVLDWTGVEIATASYFGTTIVPLLRMAMAAEPGRYFLFVGLNTICLDELRLVLELQGLVALVGEWKGRGIRNVQVLGNLDAAYVETLEAVQQVDAASATELHRKHQGRTRIGKTGWINRLSNLHRLRLVRKQRVGREYVFQSVTKEKSGGY